MSQKSVSMKWPFVKNNQIILKETNLFSSQEFNLNQLIKDVSLKYNVKVEITKTENEEIIIEITGSENSRNVSTAITEFLEACPKVVEITLNQEQFEKIENDFEKIKGSLKISIDDEDVYTLVLANMNMDELKKDVNKLGDQYQFTMDWKDTEIERELEIEEVKIETEKELEIEEIGQEDEEGEFLTFEEYDIPPCLEVDFKAWMDAETERYNLENSKE
jgi:hypothetical protein